MARAELQRRGEHPAVAVVKRVEGTGKHQRFRRRPARERVRRRHLPVRQLHEVAVAARQPLERHTTTSPRVFVPRGKIVRGGILYSPRAGDERLGEIRLERVAGDEMGREEITF